MRDNFRAISLKHMCSRADAWKLLTEEIVKATAETDRALAPDDFTWIQEVLSGLLDPTTEDAKRIAKRSDETQPLQEAMAALLGPDKSKKTLPIA